jgi:hypothetical protein
MVSLTTLYLISIVITSIAGMGSAFLGNSIHVIESQEERLPEQPIQPFEAEEERLPEQPIQTVESEETRPSIE